MLSGYKTFLGLLIAAAPQIAHLFGYSVSGEFGAQASENIDAIITLIGSAIAVYGRLVAQSPGWFAKV